MNSQCSNKTLRGDAHRVNSYRACVFAKIKLWSKLRSCNCFRFFRFKNDHFVQKDETLCKRVRMRRPGHQTLL